MVFVWVEYSYTIHEAKPPSWNPLERLELAGKQATFRWGGINDPNETSVPHYPGWPYDPSNGSDYFERTIVGVHFEKPEPKDAPGFESYSFAPELYSVMEIDSVELIPGELIKRNAVDVLGDLLIEQFGNLIGAYADSRGLSGVSDLIRVYNLGTAISSASNRLAETFDAAMRGELSHEQIETRLENAARDLVADAVKAGGVPSVLVDAIRNQAYVYRDAGNDRSMSVHHARFEAADGGKYVIVGGAGNNILHGHERADRVSGGAGDDLLLGLGGGDTIEGNGGRDAIFGGGGRDHIASGSGSDSVFGGDAKDAIYGGTGNDILLGERGSDFIDGGGGRDVIVGGAGRDTMVGGRGADTFAMLGTADSPRPKNGRDTISDFSQEQGDKIDLSEVDANVLTPEDDSFSFIGRTAFSGVPGELRFDGGASRTVVYGDVDGDLIADLAIELAGKIDLQDTDFVL